MKDVFGIIFSNMHDHMVRELTSNRCMGSLPVGGRYRLVDFVLSGFSGAGIINTAVIAKKNYKSLLDHLGNGREWDLARKRGGLMILPPAALTDAGDMYKGRVEALSGILHIIQQSDAKYILTADCDLMANVDYEDFVRQHKKSGADITVMYKKQYLDGAVPREVSAFTVDDDNNVTDMRITADARGEQNEYLNIMIISKDLLEWVLKDCFSHNQTSFNRDVLQANIGKFNIKAYEFTDFSSRFDSIAAYFESNLSLLDPKVRASLFRADRPIRTRVWDEAPVRYGLNAKVENSLLADGCVIEGEVENSLLFRGVTIGKGAKVKNCVLMQGTVVEAYANLECVITDKKVIVRENRTMISTGSYPMYIAKGAVV